MSSGLDTSLDDLIKQNKRSGDGNTRRRGSASGPTRRASNRSGNRSAPYSPEKPPRAPDTVWQHDMYSDSVAPSAPRASAIQTGTKVYISNLDYGVSNDDIKELFSEVGDLKRFSVHYDRSGRSKGTAEIVFSRRADAAAAVTKYNNVQLDGKPMKVEIVGTNIMAPGPSKSGPGQESSMGPPRGQRRRRGGRGRRQSGKERGEKVSSEDLDADLDKYHSESMQVN